jgi:hypothetical protein
VQPPRTLEIVADKAGIEFCFEIEKQESWFFFVRHHYYMPNS